MRNFVCNNMKNNLKKITRGEKIILFIYELGNHQKKRLTYEDIVVGLFKKYPNDFHLKGYPEYPDSSDSSQRSLYEFKKKGYITAENKIFCLTDIGLEFAKKIFDKISSIGDGVLVVRESRATTVEIERIAHLEGFMFFVEEKSDLLTESDFYNYLGITAKTSPSAFSGRLKAIGLAIDDMRLKQGDPLYTNIIEYHEFLTERYKNIIDFFNIKK